MPELPEVETVRRSIEKFLLEQSLEKCECKRHDLRYSIPVKALEDELPGATLDAIERRGKVLIGHWQLGPRKRRCLLMHLGMSGRLIIQEREKKPPVWQKHEHVRWTFTDHLLSFIDPRRFGSVEICTPGKLSKHDRVKNLGVEPLGDEFTPALLFEQTRGRSQCLRDLLILGKVVAGVGNIYANEALFRAGVRPQRRSNKLKKREAKVLVPHVKDVLNEAVEAGGSTLSSGGYVDGEGKSGWFQFSHAVYGRDGQPCPSCQTKIKRVRALKRGAFYCSKCQK